MKDIAHFQFEAPKIIGILSDKSVPIRLQKQLDRLLKRLGPAYICLPFQVEQKYLKNVLACMRIMDIEGMIVLGSHARRIVRFISRLTKSADKAGMINAIKRRKNQFYGHYIKNGRDFYPNAIDLLISI